MASKNAEAIKRMLNSAERGASQAPYLRKDHGLTLLKPEDGIMRLDILGCVIKKQKIAHRTTTYAEPGQLAPWRYFQCHKDVGPNRERVICPARTYGRKCPICEESTRRYRAGADKKELEIYYTTARRLCAVHHKKKLYLADFSDFLVGKPLDAWLKSDLEKYADFACHKISEGGRTLKIMFVGEKVTIGNRPSQMFKAANISSFPRKEEIPAAILKALPDLDSLLIEHSYDELKEMWESTSVDSDADEDVRSSKKSSEKAKPSGKKRKPADDEDDDEDDEETPFDDEDDEDLDDEESEALEDDDDDDSDDDDESDDDESDDDESDDDESDDDESDDDDDDSDEDEESEDEDDSDEDEESEDEDDSDDEEEEEVVTKPRGKSGKTAEKQTPPKGKAKPAKTPAKPAASTKPGKTTAKTSKPGAGSSKASDVKAKPGKKLNGTKWPKR